MKLTADFFVVRERLCNGICNKQRLQRSKTDARMPAGSAGALYGVQQRNAGLGKIPSVACKVDARENDFPVTFGGQHSATSLEISFSGRERSGPRA
jgi:hypothetical protein